MPGFTLRTEDKKLSFKSRFFDKPPQQVAGGPVLARVERPKKKSLTEWTNREPFSQELNFKLHDESEQGEEIEAEIRKLEKMQGLDRGDPEPPHVTVMGDPPGCVPHDLHDWSEGRWWVEAVVEDVDKTRRNKEGNRFLYIGTIKLTEVVEDDTLTELPHKKKRKPKQKRYKVRKGDTLSKIAKDEKVKGGWQALAKLNKIRDPKKIKIGQTLRLP